MGIIFGEYSGDNSERLTVIVSHTNDNAVRIK